MASHSIAAWPGCLLLAVLAAPSAGSRVATAPARRGGQASWAAQDCAYPDSVGFQPGDKVRIHDPHSPEATTDRIYVVGCPLNSPFLVCVEESSLCYDRTSLRRMSDVDLRLANLFARAKQFASACAQKAGEYWPMVQEKFAMFAHITLEKVSDIAAQFFEAVNICDVELRNRVHRTFATIHARVVTLSSAAAQRWPHVQAKLADVTGATAAGIVKISSVLSEAITKQYWEREYATLLANVSESVGQLVSGAVDENPKLDLVVESIGKYAEQVGELSGKLNALAIGAYNSNRVQEALATVQAGAGRLVAAAAERWPDVKTGLAAFAALTASKVEELGLRAFEEVNICNPEKQEQVKAALAAVGSRVKDLAGAVTEQLPTVKRGLQDLAESMSTTVRDLLAKLAQSVSDAAEREDVQQALGQIQLMVAQLHELVAEKASSMQPRAWEFAEAIVEKVRAIIRKLTRGESSGFDDEEGLAEL